MLKLAINTVGDELEASAAFCRKEKIGIEITDFAFPATLDGDVQGHIERHRKAVAGITPLSSHGPFFDLIVTSIDPDIVAVSRKRHEAAMAASIEFGASLYITHTNYTPLIKNVTYRKNWFQRTIDFWLPYADEAGKAGMTICLEHLWEPEPELHAELITAANHPHLRATLDNGHCLVFSKASSSKWVETLGDLLVHCHVHDNSGELDEHKPVGEGIEAWPSLMAALRRFAPEAVLVAESDSLDDNRRSVTYLRGLEYNESRTV